MSSDVVNIPTMSFVPGVTALVGVNGAGKTTLLRTLAGVRRPQSGRVTITDVALYSRARGRLLPRIGFMPQESFLPGQVSARDALAYCGWLRGLAQRDCRHRADYLLELVGLSDRAGDKIRDLSGGMIRRALFAYALMTDPDVLLLDEPTTGLDPEQRVRVRQLIEETNQDRPRTVIVSSHLMEDVQRLADHVVILNAGGALFSGSLTVLLDDHGGPERSAEHAFVSLLHKGQD